MSMSLLGAVIMKLTILGSGTANPNPHRASPGYVLTIGSQNFVVDCGTGTLLQLIKTGVDLEQLDGIFITHFHLDHCGDIPAIVNTLLHSQSLSRKKDLHIYGYMGIKKMWETLQQIHPDLQKNSAFKVVIHELAVDQEIHLADGVVKTYPVRHIESSLAYRFTSNAGNVVVFSGDTGYDQKVVELAKGADIAVFECNWPEEYFDASRYGGTLPAYVDLHLNPTLAGDLAQQAHVKTLVLSHISPPTDQYPIARRCQKVFSGNVVVAEDFMMLEASNLSLFLDKELGSIAS